MSFKRGKSGNPSGRPKGARNHATSELIKRIGIVLDESTKRLQDDLYSLQPIDRIKAITGLIGYVIPKKQAISMQQSLDYEYYKLEELLNNAPDEALDKILNKIQELKEREVTNGE